MTTWWRRTSARWYALGALCALIAVAVSARPASAHPLGNFTINHLTKVSMVADRIEIKYVLDIAEIPTFQIMRERGMDGSGHNVQLQRWASDEAATVMQGLNVSVGGTTLRLSASTPAARTRPGAGGLPTLYWVDEFHATLPKAGAPRHIDVRDDVNAERIGWRDVVVAPDQEPTNELRSYPPALIGSPRHIAGVRLTIDSHARVVARETLGTADAAPAVATSQLRSNALSDMLAKGVSNPWLVLATLLMAIALGALHALEPGHGKTLLAVSLVGARATAAQALILATGLTFAHTAGVLGLGLLLLAAAQWIVPENVYPWITVGSGTLAAILGAGALARYVRRCRGEDHEHHSVGAAGHAHDHAHEGPHGHRHVPDGAAPLSFPGVVLMAMSGNIAPCPAALVVLLTALTLHQLGYGLLVIVAFSIGLAGVLTGLGVALVRGASWLSNQPRFDSVVAYGPLVSAGVIAVVGALMLGQGASSSMWHMPSAGVTALVLVAIAGYALAPGHSHAHGQPTPALDRGPS